MNQKALQIEYGEEELMSEWDVQRKQVAPAPGDSEDMLLKKSDAAYYTGGNYSGVVTLEADFVDDIFRDSLPSNKV